MDWPAPGARHAESASPGAEHGWAAAAGPARQALIHKFRPRIRACLASIRPDAPRRPQAPQAPRAAGQGIAGAKPRPRSAQAIRRVRLHWIYPGTGLAPTRGRHGSLPSQGPLLRTTQSPNLRCITISWTLQTVDKIYELVHNGLFRTRESPRGINLSLTSQGHASGIIDGITPAG